MDEPERKRKGMFLYDLPDGADAYLRGLAAASGLPLVRVVAALAAHAQTSGWFVTADQPSVMIETRNE
jgi:hypothetical protein